MWYMNYDLYGENAAHFELAGISIPTEWGLRVRTTRRASFFVWIWKGLWAMA